MLVFEVDQFVGQYQQSRKTLALHANLISNNEKVFLSACKIHPDPLQPYLTNATLLRSIGHVTICMSLGTMLLDPHFTYTAVYQ